MRKPPIIDIFSDFETINASVASQAAKAAQKIAGKDPAAAPGSDLVIAPRQAGPFFILASIKTVREPAEGDCIYLEDDDGYEDEVVYPQEGEVYVSDVMGERYVARDVILNEGFRQEGDSDLWVRRESEPMRVICAYEVVAAVAGVDEVDGDDPIDDARPVLRFYRCDADGVRGERIEATESLYRCTEDGRIIAPGGMTQLLSQVKEVVAWRDGEGRPAADVAAANAHLAEITARNAERVAGAEVDSLSDAADIHLVNLEINVTAAGIKPRTSRVDAEAVMQEARMAAEAEGQAAMNWPAPAPEGLTYDTLPQILATAMRQWSDANGGALARVNEYGEQVSSIPATGKWGRLGSHHTRYAEDAVRAIGEFIFEDEFRVDMGRLRYLSTLAGVQRETVAAVRQWAEANGEVLNAGISFEDVMQTAVRKKRIGRNPMPGYDPRVDLIRANGADLLFVEDFNGSYVYSWPSDMVRQLELEPPAPTM